jgi:NAD(P)H-hydrate repair Nnr-like enzyme with NAD(P)H-hydrate epimerase domain
MGDKDGIALTLNDLGEVARHRGELDKALTTFEQAKTVAQEADDKSAVAYVLSGRGDVLTDRGDLVAARKSYEEALTIRKQTGEKQTAAETELALAHLAIEEGRSSDAETVIRKCKEQFHQDQQADDELAASTVLIDALLAESKLPEQGIVMEVGSCKTGPYGLFVFTSSAPCPPASRAIVVTCPEGATDCGFVVTAPSRGMKSEQFRDIIELSMGDPRTYVLGGSQTVDVPIGVKKMNGGTQSAAPSKHTVTFRWPVVDGASILDDTAAPGLFDSTALGSAPKSWPTALGHVSAPDSAGASTTLIHNSGKGCFTVAGFPTPADPNPIGLFVDFRNLNSPVVADRPTSDLAALCP